MICKQVQLNGQRVLFLTIQHKSFVCTEFKTNSSIWPKDRTLSSATTLGQSGSGSNSNSNEGVLHIPQSSKTGASPSDCFMSYPGHSGKSYPCMPMWHGIPHRVMLLFSLLRRTWAGEDDKFVELVIMSKARPLAEILALYVV